MRIAIVLHLTTNGCATSDVYRTYKISAASTVDLDNNGVVFIIRARLIGWKSHRANRLQTLEQQCKEGQSKSPNIHSTLESAFGMRALQTIASFDRSSNDHVHDGVQRLVKMQPLVSC